MTWLVELIARGPGLALACFLAGAAFGVGGAWWVQGLRLDRLAAEHEMYKVYAVGNAEKLKGEIDAWKDDLARKSREADQKEAEMAAHLHSLDTDVGRLRNTNAALSARLRNQPDGIARCAANAQAAATLGELFGECVQEYQTLGRAAEGHANDVRRMSQGSGIGSQGSGISPVSGREAPAMNELDSRFRGNDGGLDTRFLIPET